MEVWKRYNDTRYSVSSFGNVRNDETGKLLRVNVDSEGYAKVCIYENNKGVAKRVHKLIQLAFDLEYGMIDHCNGIRTDNRLENLRVMSNRANSSNREYHRNGKLVGASATKYGTWRAGIRHNKVQVHLGSHPTELEAHNAYIAYKILHNI